MIVSRQLTSPHHISLKSLSHLSQSHILQPIFLFLPVLSPSYLLSSLLFSIFHNPYISTPIFFIFPHLPPPSPPPISKHHGNHADTDECVSNTHDCSAEEECENTQGSFRCSSIVGGCSRGSSWKAEAESCEGARVC